MHYRILLPRTLPVLAEWTVIAFVVTQQLIWLQQKDVGVKTGPLNVKLMDERATVDFTVVLTGGQGFIPDDGRIYQVQTGWRLEGDEWKLISATLNS